MTSVLLADLLRRCVRVEPHEAVAIAQQLIDCGGAAPSAGNVRLDGQGGVHCIGSDATPGVYELAIFLQTLLPFDRIGIPGGLRYVIARGLHEVEARPFDSVDELSRALERFERGDRRTVVKSLVQRASDGDAAPTTAPVFAPVPVVTPVPAATLARPPMAATPTQDLPAARRWRAPAFAAAVAGCAIGSLATAGLMTMRDRATHSRGGYSSMGSAATSAPPPYRTAAPLGVRENPSSTVSTPSSPKSPAKTPPAPRTRVPRHAAGLQARTNTGAEMVAALDEKRRPVFSPAFASNGSALFFHTGDAHAPRSAIAVSNGAPGYDLQVMTILDDGARNYHVQPSPDGRMIAFDSDRDGERGVYIARRDGTDVRRVSGPGYAAVPTWSPDGHRLAYIRAEASNPKVWNLWIQSLEDGRTARLTSYTYGQTWSASWFPDNRRVAYSHEDRLIIKDLDTGREQAIASPVKGRLVRTPAVSPDGSKVIFQVFRHGAWLLNVADGSVRFVLTDPTAEEFAWAPDGRHVAFHSRRDGQWGIYVIAG